MRPEPPLPPDSAGTVERLANVATRLTLRNVLAVCVLMVAAAPAYIAWEIVHNDKVRAAVFSSVRIVEGLEVPCLVYAIQITGQPERHAVILAYDTEGKFEHTIAIRSAGVLSLGDTAKACDIAHKQADLIRTAIGFPSERK
jgi:hypothetical protein